MSSKNLLRPILGLLALSLATSSTAQTIDNLSYFETQVPGACTAGDPANLGTFSRQFKAPTGTCPGLVVYHAAKGAGSVPWASESFYVQNNYLKQMIELSYDQATGSITGYRAFRDTASGSKGVISMPATMPPSGSFYTVPSYVEEHWVDDTGQPACYNTQHSRVDNGSLTNASAALGGALVGWLQDKRSVSQNKNTWHDVLSIVRTEYWAGNFYENYTYGRWRNPATNTWQGLGLVKWEWWQISPSQRLAYAENHYLVNCSVAIPCTTCPP